MLKLIIAVLFAWPLLAQVVNPGGNGGGGSGNATSLQGRALAATAPADTNTICWSAGGATWQPCSAAGGGTVTSASFTGGLISVASPTTTPAFTVAGTSGGIPYFSAASTWASSGVLTVNGVVLGGGAGATPTVTSADSTTTHALFATAGAPAFRALTSGDLPAGTGTVTSVSVTTANGVSGSVATATTTPAITLTLGAITPTTIVASGAVTAPSLGSGTSPPAVTPGTGGVNAYAEGTNPGSGCPAVSVDCIVGNAAAHRAQLSNNNGTLSSVAVASDPLTFFAATAFTGDATTTFPALTIGNGAITAVKMVNAGVLTGDVTTTFPAVTVARVNGITYSATAAAHSVEVITTANTTATAKVIPDCTDVTGNHINYTQSSDAFSCGTSSSGSGGTGTSITSTTPVTVNTNTTSDQQLMELTMSAGYFNSSKQPFLFNGAGVYTTQTAQTPTITFKIKLCTVSGCGSGTVVTLVSVVSTATVAAVTNNNWNLSAMGYTATTGATGNLEIHGPVSVDLGALTTTADSIFNDTNTAVSSNIDLTAALFVDFTVAFSTNAATANTFTQRSGGVMPFAATAAPVTSVFTQTGAVGNLTGDVTTAGSVATTVGKVNGIAYSATAAAHSVEVVTTANTTATAKVMPDCTDTGGNHINFTQSTDAFSCGTSGGAGASPIIIFNDIGTALGTNATKYYGILSASSFRTSTAMMMTASGTLTKVYIGAAAAPGAGQTFVGTVYYCSGSISACTPAATNITCTMTGTGSANAICNGTGSQAYVAGDSFALQLVSSASAASTTFFGSAQ